MKPSLSSLTFFSRPSRSAWRKGMLGWCPHPSRALRCSCTASPSENQRGTRLSDTARWKVWASSCQKTEAQL